MAPTPQSRRDKYCCMEKLGKCKKNLRKKKRWTAITQHSFSNAFETFIGDNAHLFGPGDAVCQTHRAEILKPKQPLKKKNTASKSVMLPSPSKLQSGTVKHDPIIASSSTAGPSSLLTTSETFVPPPMHPTELLRSQDLGEMIDTEELQYPNSEDFGSNSFLIPSQVLQTSNNSFGISQSSFDSITLTPRVPENSQDTVLSSSSRRSVLSGPMRCGTMPIIIPGVQSVGINQSRCSICRRPGRKMIPMSARVQVWKLKRIIIPSGNRCCVEHLENGMFVKMH